jgi:hypothetical protein
VLLTGILAPGLFKRQVTVVPKAYKHVFNLDTRFKLVLASEDRPPSLRMGVYPRSTADESNFSHQTLSHLIYSVIPSTL